MFVSVMVITSFVWIYMYQKYLLGVSPTRDVPIHNPAPELNRLSSAINRSSFLIKHSSLGYKVQSSSVMTDHLPSLINYPGRDLLNRSTTLTHSSCPRHYLVRDGKSCPTPTSQTDFIGVDHPFYFYGYSAFLQTDKPRTRIAVIFISVLQIQHKKSRCSIQVEDSEEYVEGNVVLYHYTMTIHDKSKFGQLCSGIILCDYPKRLHNHKVARNVRLYTGNTTLSILPVEKLAEPSKRKSLALCLPRVYQAPYCAECSGINYTYHLPEWIEMQRILGVDTIFVYNVSMGDDASLIFNYYARQGFVVLLSHAPIHNKTYMPVSMGIIECIHRNRYVYDYVLAIDMDEFIIPTKWNTYQEIIRDLLNESTYISDFQVDTS